MIPPHTESRVKHIGYVVLALGKLVLQNETTKDMTEQLITYLDLFGVSKHKKLRKEERVNGVCFSFINMHFYKSVVCIVLVAIIQ